MSIAIRAVVPAFPGLDRISGDVLTGIEIFEKKVGKAKARMYKGKIREQEERTGIQTRNVIDKSLQEPNTYLAAAAGHRLIEKLGLDRSKIQGFIFASSTPDYIFPPPGVSVMDALELSPRKWINTAMACSSLASTIEIACFWMERMKLDNVLIITCDVTTRLELPNNHVERLLFGDAGVAIYLEKGKSNEKGGFVVTDNPINKDASSLVRHKAYYPDDLPRGLLNNGLVKKHYRNDLGYIMLQAFERLEWADELEDFTRTTGDIVDWVIPPQVSQNIIVQGLERFQQSTGEDISGRTISDSFATHGNSGTAAAGAALSEAMKTGKIQQNDSFGIPFVALGGTSAYLGYDPTMREDFHYEHIDFRKERPPTVQVLSQKLERHLQRQAADQNGNWFGLLRVLGRPLTRATKNHAPEGNGHVNRIKDQLTLL